jgi:hypothetical protein
VGVSWVLACWAEHRAAINGSCLTNLGAFGHGSSSERCVQIALAVPRRYQRSSRSWSSLVIISLVILPSGCFHGWCSLGCCGPCQGCFGPVLVCGPVLSCCGFLGWCGPLLVWRGLVMAGLRGHVIMAGSRGPVMAVVLGCCGPGFSLVLPAVAVVLGSSGPGTCGPGCSGLDSGFQRN